MAKTGSDPAKILIVDNESVVRDLLVALFSTVYECEAVGSVADAIERLGRGKYAVLICDADLSDSSGLSIIPDFLKVSPDTVVIMMSGNPATEDSLEALRLGAAHFLSKPFELEELEQVVGAAASIYGRKRHTNSVTANGSEQSEEGYQMRSESFDGWAICT